MAKLYSSAHIIKILKKNGFYRKGQRGSHCKYQKGNKTVIIAHPKKEIPQGTLASILRQSGLDKDLFLKK